MILDRMPLTAAKQHERDVMAKPAIVVEEKDREEIAVDDLVQVWVPKAYLTDVYGLIARLGAERVEERTEKPLETSTGEAEKLVSDSDGENSDSGIEAVKLREKLWTEKPELLKRLYLESPFGMLRVMNYLADNTDRWIHSSELHAAIEPGRTSKSSPFGPFGRRVKNRYKMHVWPFAGELGQTDEWGLGYRMGVKVAEQINSYRKDVISRKDV